MRWWHGMPWGSALQTCQSSPSNHLPLPVQRPLWSGHNIQAGRTSQLTTSCLYFCPNVFLLPRAVPYASIFCIIVHGIVFLTVYLNLPPAGHLIQCNQGLQAYNTHQKRTSAETQSIPDFLHWHNYAYLPDQQFAVRHAWFVITFIATQACDMHAGSIFGVHVIFM